MNHPSDETPNPHATLAFVNLYCLAKILSRLYSAHGEEVVAAALDMRTSSAVVETKVLGALNGLLRALPHLDALRDCDPWTEPDCPDWGWGR